MKTIKNTFAILILLFITTGCLGQKSQARKFNKTVKAKSEAQCNDKDGYWYNGKCWANFKDFDEGISKEEIDSVVEKQIALLSNYGVTIDGKKYPIDLFMTEEAPEDNVLVLITIYTDEKGKKSIIQFTQLDAAENKEFNTKIVIIPGDVTNSEGDNIDELIENSKLKGDLKGVIVSEDDSQMEFKGTITNSKTNKDLKVSVKVGDAIGGMGDTTLNIKGDKAYLNGTLGTKGYAQFKDLIKNHPEVKTIVLQNVPGSINDAVNMHTGRIIREAGLNTMVLADSKISSGGVDLFCAGKERIVTKGAELGIHSWGGDGISADDLSKDHPAHQYQIAYFTMCLGKEMGPDFYFRTLSAAPAGEMYWMKDKEIKQKVATKFIEE